MKNLPRPEYPSPHPSETFEAHLAKVEQWERDMVSFRRSKPLLKRLRKGWLEGFAEFHLQVFGKATRYRKSQVQLEQERRMEHMERMAERMREWKLPPRPEREGNGTPLFES
ncbi:MULTISPECIES: hypothetical protein [Arthrobacter]|uniref:Uncharacterized protein n=1 Tax=Arthrobacter terricola TaxID=2547396 RepID=A0A4R5KQA5_9MICC|nr:MULTISPECIES: hypothetical protein [Arthrobacter]MBT8161016.1 hypothetical protein [Arthrobacter sp. GN70]TDF96880.1 hypothetical protein E1809_09155 [Arthrobacter terricola]